MWKVVEEDIISYLDTSMQFIFSIKINLKIHKMEIKSS